MFGLPTYWLMGLLIGYRWSSSCDGQLLAISLNIFSWVVADPALNKPHTSPAIEAGWIITVDLSAAKSKKRTLRRYMVIRQPS